MADVLSSAAVRPSIVVPCVPAVKPRCAHRSRPPLVATVHFVALPTCAAELSPPPAADADPAEKNAHLAAWDRFKRKQARALAAAKRIAALPPPAGAVP